MPPLPPHPDLLAVGLRQSRYDVCITDPNQSFTFTDVDERASRLVAALRAQGVKRGDRIALLAHNSAEYLELMVAAQRGGFILTPLNWRFTVPELSAVIADCTPRLLIHQPSFADTVADMPDYPQWTLDETYADRLAAHEPAPPEPIDPDAPCEILYTSATTGVAKGAMVTNRSHLARMCTVSLDLAIRAEDVFLQVMPMFHIMVIFTHAFAFRGARNVILPRFDPAAVFAGIEGERVTHTALVPTAVDALVAAPQRADTDCSSLRTIMYGASPITSAALRRALDAFDCGFTQIYGMTEVGTATLLSPADHDPDARPDLLASAGRDMALIEIDIVDAAGRSCPPGTPGEIVISGPGVTDGYWNDPEATEAALPDGRMRSGDLGVRDEQGYIFVTDRIKDIIVTGGENVSPREVEEVLEQHPDVRECAVIGVADERYVESVHAVVVLEEGRELDDADLRAHCAKSLAGYKCPRAFSVAVMLPRNPVGKLLRKNLRESRLS